MIARARPLLAFSLPIAIFGIGVLVTFAMQVFVSRAIGPAEFGAFSVIYATCAIASAAGAAGHDMGALRFGAIYRHRRGQGSFRAYARWVVRDVVRWVPLAMAGTALWLIVDGIGAAVPVILALAVTAGWAMARLGCSLIRSEGRAALSLVPDRIVREGCVLIVAIAASAGLIHLRLSGALAALAVGSVIAASMCALLLRGALTRQANDGGPERRALKWRTAALGLLLLNLAELVSTRSETLTLSIVASPETVAYLTYASIAASTIAIPQLALNTIFMPMLARARRSADRSEMKRLATRFGLLSTLAAAPIVTAGVLGPDLILRLFGAPPNVPGLTMGMVLLIMSRAVTLPLSAAMPIAMMTGRQLVMLYVFLSVIVLKIVLVTAGFMVAGIFGVCAATALTLVLLSTGQVIALAVNGGWHGRR